MMFFAVPTGVILMKQISIFALSALALSLAGATFAQTPPVPVPNEVDGVKHGKPRAPNAADGGERDLYQYLIAEIAGQRGGGAQAIQSLLDLAKRTRDARVARRAVEVAFQSREMNQAIDGATLWLELEPESALAKQALAVIVASQGSLETTQQTMTRWLAEPGKAATIFPQLPAVLARYGDKAKAAKAVSELAKPYPKLAEAQYAISLSAVTSGDKTGARNAVEEALRLKPAWGQAAVLKAQLLREQSEDEAAKYLESFLQLRPDARDVRQTYARLLVAQKSYLSAREQFRLLDKTNTNDPELPYSIALISQQMEDYVEADKAFRRTLTLDPRDANPVRFNLGAVAEARKDIAGAIEWYEKVDDGEYLVSAKLKTASLVAKRDGIESGRKVLREAQIAENDSPETRVQLILAEAQLLRDAKAFKEAYALLDDAVAKNADRADLLYDRAMVAERLNKLDVLEADLKKVIELKPDYAHAYNALGYTFAERGVRLKEASELIQKALALAPDDAFIQDSLGWVQFKQGRTEEAIATLRKAYTVRRDPEIAAHLGEVLWAAGKKDEAMQLWRSALSESPGNDTLMAVIEKHKP
jgi:tetratricopeptide (TPR) repeat protein